MAALVAASAGLHAQGSRSSLERRVVWPAATEDTSLWRNHGEQHLAFDWTSRAVAKSEAWMLKRHPSETTPRLVWQAAAHRRWWPERSSHVLAMTGAICARPHPKPPCRHGRQAHESGPEKPRKSSQIASYPSAGSQEELKMCR